KKYMITAQELMDDWIDNTYPGQKNSWEAYTISIRLISWSYVWEVLQKSDIEIYKGFREKFIGSIEQQIRFLYSNLEKDLANNHYTANGKTLFWVGVSFPFIQNSEKYLNAGIKILYSQLLKEIRQDGSQYENSTSYQVMTTKDYLEVLIYANKNNISLPKEFYSYTERMFDFIISLLKPDKTLPLLNVSVKYYPINLNELLAVGSVFFNKEELKFAAGDVRPYYLLKIYGFKGYEKYKKGSESFPKYNSIFLNGSNYGVMRNGWKKDNNYLLFDAGDIGPKHNAGHAHADNLSIFLHANNEDIFIHSRNYEYKKNNKRDYYKTTMANNNIEIEKENQTTFWGAFRTGHIANSRLIDLDLDSSTQKISAMHDGYRRLKQNIIHKREVLWNQENTWILKDTVTGRNSTQGKLYFQLGKTCKNISVSSNSCILRFNNLNVYLEFTSDTEINVLIEDACISDEWKKEIK